MLEKFEKLYSELEEQNEEIFSKCNWCREHNMGFEADALYMKYQHGRNILSRFRWLMNDLK